LSEHPRLGSIPQQTMRDVWKEQARERASLQISINPLKTDRLTFGQTQPDTSLESSDFDISRHIFRKPSGEKTYKPLIVPEPERITWEVEVHGDYETQGSLGLILQFSGIDFTNAPVFIKSKVNYGQDSSAFYSRIGYKNGLAFLILATYGDIFESQVVATKIDERPFFREEAYLPQLTVTHDPTSMTVYEKNHLVVVGYKRL